MTSLNETMKRITSNIKKSKKGNPIGSFSRNDFNQLVNAYMNDTSYQMDYCVIRDGKKEVQTIPVVKEFREKVLVPLLVEFGVDKQEAVRVIDSYKFKQNQTDGFYELIMDIVYRYMETGKKLNFPSREDFNGSIRLKDIEGGVTVNREGKKVERKNHKSLVKKSSCPSWLRHALQ